MHRLSITTLLCICMTLRLTSAVTQGRPTPDATVTVTAADLDTATLEAKAPLFSNRDYLIRGVPERFLGLRFTRLAGGVTANAVITTDRTTEVYLMTGPGLDNLETQGWTRIDDAQAYYTDDDKTRLDFYRRALRADETFALPTGNWTGGILLHANLAVHRPPDLSSISGQVVTHARATSREWFVRTGLVRLPAGRLVTAVDRRDADGGALRSQIYGSDDHGRTWRPLGLLPGMRGAAGWAHQDALYVMGIDVESNAPVVAVSRDGGATWRRGELLSDIADGDGRITELGSISIAKGRVWVTFTIASPSGVRTGVISADQEADPRETGSWTHSGSLAAAGSEQSNASLSNWPGVVIASRGGHALHLMGTRDSQAQEITLAELDERRRSFRLDDTESGISFPGASGPFRVRYDAVSDRYWSLTNWVMPHYAGDDSAGEVRNTVALVSSHDLQDWQLHRVVLHHHDATTHGFGGIEWVFDGEDILAVSATSCDDGLGGPMSIDRANAITFHRVQDFREMPGRGEPRAFGIEGGEPDERLNVLLIAVDDMAVEAAAYGIEGVKTPNIDRLAERGRLFRRAYVQNAVCNPSRASLMTGKYPATLNIQTLRPHFREMYPGITTMSQYFMASGYHAVGIGKIYHNFHWDHDIHGDPLSWTEPQRYHWGSHHTDRYLEGQPFELHTDIEKGPAVQREEVPDEAYIDGRIAAAAVEKLGQLGDRDEPFFLGVGFWKPHLPFNVPARYWDMYDPDDLPDYAPKLPPPSVPKIALHDSREPRSYTDVPRRGAIPEAKFRELRHGYYAAISYVDAQVGKVLDALEHHGLSDNTVVVFWSDHGFHIGEYGLFGKLTNFEPSTRIPFIIAVPDMPMAGSATDALVESVDLYPTLVDACGLVMPDWTEGRSLAPVLRDPDARVRDAALSQQVRPMYAVDYDVLGSSIRIDRYRYVEWRNVDTRKVVAEELYDLIDDPHGTVNLAEAPEPDTSRLLKRLRDQLHRHEGLSSD